MFTDFYYQLRGQGLPVSPTEWLALMEALDKGLCRPSLQDFYQISRMLLVKSERDFDAFDHAFLQYFGGLTPTAEIPPELEEWLNTPLELPTEFDRKLAAQNARFTLEEIRKKLEERLKEQTERHDGGNYWVGTGGTSLFGNNGHSPQGIRVGGQSVHRSALQVAAEHHFADFREDQVLDLRQFQLAFRKLRQFTKQSDEQPTELDLEETIRETSDKAGQLSLCFRPPRKNAVKLLLLFDSGGSMYPYSKLCTTLFQAAHKSSHFKDVKVFYFHNCVYEHLYTTPGCHWGDWVETSWVLKNLSRDYMVLYVGDAAMAPTELFQSGGNYFWERAGEDAGIDWLRILHRRYRRSVWLNPIPSREWGYTYGSYTIQAVAKEIPMFELTIKGLEQALRCLLRTRL
ncbi:MAG: vWA domain-containing protein [Eubacteriales bacterium]|jgi:uncharacterized protein with von Willebrand factor type A (vWA) domain